MVLKEMGRSSGAGEFFWMVQGLWLAKGPSVSRLRVVGAEAGQRARVPEAGWERKRVAQRKVAYGERKRGLRKRKGKSAPGLWGRKPGQTWTAAVGLRGSAAPRGRPEPSVA